MFVRENSETVRERGEVATFAKNDCMLSQHEKNVEISRTASRTLTGVKLVALFRSEQIN